MGHCRRNRSRSTPFFIRLKVEVWCVLFFTQSPAWSKNKTLQTSTFKRMKNGVCSAKRIYTFERKTEPGEGKVVQLPQIFVICQLSSSSETSISPKHLIACILSMPLPPRLRARVRCGRALASQLVMPGCNQDIALLA